ncbi:cell division protein FtsL [Rheinheimera maricola]|uniref:Cell division protein FtsL n=1 Tax=Rheinheimera maricola TaxID=2793282 RepID=A0ABS7X8D6_9GAMM|nr:cell division protein FtsL [Rheinheimera maricola]MBZ9611370.1 cell division protein FtsL [Rheinheimera maricola]
MSSISLHRLISQDWRAQKWQVLLLLACISSALVVVHFAHLNRQLTIAQDLLYQQRDHLDIEWRNLLLEQRALAEHSRVEDIARNRLNMVRPAAEQDVAVALP